jgi:pyruvate/2-oxoacid:ferredoxin oxidoreductase beta subunit
LLATFRLTSILYDVTCKSQAEEKKTVECGYWHLWRYNPALAEEGKNPFSLSYY